MAARRADLASAALPVRRHSAALAQPTLVAANLDAYARMRLDRRPTHLVDVRRLPRPKTCGGAWAAGIASAAVRRRSTRVSARQWWYMSRPFELDLAPDREVRLTVDIRPTARFFAESCF